MTLSLDLIFVPQGPEYQAVKRAELPIPIVAIPAGLTAVEATLRRWRSQQPYRCAQRVLVMGLGGSLIPQLHPGDVVLCDRCLSPQGESQAADGPLLEQLHHLYQSQGQPLPQYSAYSSDRILHLAQQKQDLAQTSGAAVVEMEGWAIWQAFPQAAMIRVISDDCRQDLPDISKAIAPNGKLKPLALTHAFLKQPAAAINLIRGSLQGLSQLTQTAHQLSPHLTP
ncbi:phosphorylase [Sodalinema gerasimenkoae]|uniref:phosphorylase family protein n=1 Tax=Sodalinema gerasimenkoae TaxID=2862348 RepID=UPI0013578D4C|nr:phosphorylase [Sodalinema gerasimenkoae]